MKILVVFITGRGFFLECESTDTIANLQAKVHAIVDFPPDQQKLQFDGKQLQDDLTLGYYGIQEGSFLFIISRLRGGASGNIERPRSPKIGDLYYGDAFESGWSDEHGKELLHLLLKLCQDGTISDGNITEEAWHCIQKGLKNSKNCNFQINFLKERLRDYKKLYSLLANTTSPYFHWNRENKAIHIKQPYPCELSLLSGAHITYLGTLEEVCLLLNTRRSLDQEVSETSANINNEELVDQDIHRNSKARTMFHNFRQRLKRLLTCMI